VELRVIREEFADALMAILEMTLRVWFGMRLI
jgi:hypothetical protein